MLSLTRAVRALWWRRGVSAALLAIAALTTASAFLAPLYVRSVAAHALTEAVTSEPVLRTGIIVGLDVSRPGQLRRTRSPDHPARAVADLLARVGLDGRAGWGRVDQLSGGQQQPLAVARAVIGEPEIVLADEPTAELDPETREVVLTLLVEQARRGAVVVIATHDPEVAGRCDRELHLVDGLAAPRAALTLG